MAKLEAGDKSSNSLLANVLDMDDDFLLAGGLRSTSFLELRQYSGTLVDDLKMKITIFPSITDICVHLSSFLRDFGDSREGCAGQGSIQTRPPGGRFSFLPKLVFL